ncbi:hypothetical protein [Marinococcus luteus]|uniref:hypothetical protein n=1 Tax=Marinococcus luteus TaxID=1122204 RepID=UPI002ACCA303|nr:hypothetical protein [Marinococcus luteus]MDZ5784608.1 hypothetical protein [Marinococcus luteus]
MSLNILDLLRADGSIVVNKKLAHQIGLETAAIYSELVSLFQYWSKRGELVDDNKEKSAQAKWFFVTIENLEENTTLKRSKQDKAIKKLKELGLIETRQMGLPKKRYFTITEKINEFITAHKSVENKHSDNDSGSKVDNEANNSSNTENTQSVENEHSGVSNSNTLNCSISTTNNTRTNNTKINKESIVNKNVNNYSSISKNSLENENQENEIKKIEKEFQSKGLSSKVIRLVKQEVDAKKNEIKNYIAYYRTCLDNALYKSQFKKGEITELYPHLPDDHPLRINWLQ